jgi:hypothetical protein
MSSSEITGSVRDGADQFLEAGGAHDLQVERLVTPHDLVVALGLLDQVRHARAQGPVFGHQFVQRRCPTLVHDIPFLQVADKFTRS